MGDIKVGDRVGAIAAVRQQFYASGGTTPLYGHVISVRGQSLIWVRDHTGGEWGLPANCLEHID